MSELQFTVQSLILLVMCSCKIKIPGLVHLAFVVMEMVKGTQNISTPLGKKENYCCVCCKKTIRGPEKGRRSRTLFAASEKWLWGVS
jgi:hypothetical protein